MWMLRTLTSDQPERVFRILPGGVRTVGRATGADFIVDAALVSRVHCRLTALPDGQLEVRDLGSTNGTFVNGQRVEQAQLNDGDRLQVGRLELIVSRDGAGTQDEPQDKPDADVPVAMDEPHGVDQPRAASGSRRQRR
jgi:pSer/pThr/pTyr-binding forkhead associated (FHA) protein